MFLSIFLKCRNCKDFTRYAQARQLPLKSLEFSKQLPDVTTQIKRDISCKLDVNFRQPGV